MKSEIKCASTPNKLQSSKNPPTQITKQHNLMEESLAVSYNRYQQFP